MLRSSYLVALAALALPAVAEASGPPLDVSVTTPAPDADVHGQIPADTPFTVSGPDDFQDLHFHTTAGRDYWLGVAEPSGGRLQLFDPTGRLLADLRGFGGGGNSDAQGGLELHATLSGTYLARVWLNPPYDSGGAYPSSGYAWLWDDCRGGPATRCTIKPGQVLAGTWGGLGDYLGTDGTDGDAFRILAKPGSRLAAELTIVQGQAAPSFAVLDSRGHPVPWTRRYFRLSFTMPSRGCPCFVKTVASGADHLQRGTYTVSLVKR